MIPLYGNNRVAEPLLLLVSRQVGEGKPERDAVIGVALDFGDPGEPVPIGATGADRKAGRLRQFGHEPALVRVILAVDQDLITPVTIDVG